MHLKDAVRLLEGGGDAAAKIALPIEVGFGAWRDNFPKRLRKLGLRCGLDRISTEVRAAFPVYVVTVRCEGPASKALSFVRSLEAIG